MKTSFKSLFFRRSRAAQAGNAMIYVLIAIVLFAALSLIVARQGDDSESSALSTQRANIVAAQLIATSMQLKQGVDQMLYSGSNADTLDFVTPDDEPAFSAGTNQADKVFHPAGGGIILQPIPSDAVNQVSADPPARWYIGRFLNVEWTSTTAEDVIMVAHQVNEQVCRSINEKILGSPTPLISSINPRDILIDDVAHNGSNPGTWLTASCPTCAGKISACMVGPSEIPGRNIYSFYSLVISR